MCWVLRLRCSYVQNYHAEMRNPLLLVSKLICIGLLICIYKDICVCISHFNILLYIIQVYYIRCSFIPFLFHSAFLEYRWMHLILSCSHNILLGLFVNTRCCPKRICLPACEIHSYHRSYWFVYFLCSGLWSSSLLCGLPLDFILYPLCMLFAFLPISPSCCY